MQKVSFLADSDTVVNYDRKMLITLDRGGGGVKATVALVEKGGTSNVNEASKTCFSC
jgi:hypothetical protein